MVKIIGNMTGGCPRDLELAVMDGLENKPTFEAGI